MIKDEDGSLVRCGTSALYLLKQSAVLPWLLLVKVLRRRLLPIGTFGIHVEHLRDLILRFTRFITERQNNGRTLMLLAFGNMLTLAGTFHW